MSIYKSGEMSPFSSQRPSVDFNRQLLPSDSIPAMRTSRLLTLSASSEQFLARIRLAIAQDLKLNPELNLADVAYTLQMKRLHKSYRWTTVCTTREEAITALEGASPGRARQGFAPAEKPPVFFMFPGQGSEFVRMGLEFYETQSTFRQCIDQCCDWVRPILGRDLRSVLYPEPERRQWASEQLQKLNVMQPALFVVEYALAQLLMKWGIRPDAMAGHSVGEYVVAALSEVMSPREALLLVSIRGQLLEEVVAPGGMLAVALSEEEARKWVGPGTSLAAVNAPDQCVLSGTAEALAELANKLAQEKIYCRTLPVTRAGHSSMVESVLPVFSREAAKIQFQETDRPYLSAVTGGWLSAKEVAKPEYWVRHLREPVRFAAALESLMKESGRAVLIEVGPGQALSSVARLVRRNLGLRGTVSVISLMRPFGEDEGSFDYLLQAAGKLWLAGVPLDWERFYSHEARQFLPLPALEAACRAEDEAPRIPIDSRSSGEDGYMAPRSATEALLCKQWRELFGDEEIGVYDDFFELGGNSLTAMRLFARIRQFTGHEIPLQAIFEHSKVAQLAQWIERHAPVHFTGEGGSPDNSRLVPLPARPERLPLSYAQQRLWFIDQLEGPNTEYNAPEALRLRGELNLAALESAVSAIVERHEILRTHFTEVDAEPAQVIAPPAPVRLPLEDLSEMDSASQRVRIASVLDQEWELPFDLSRGPVWRMKVLKLGRQDHVLVRTFHHIAFDGWSLSVFNRELAALYKAFARGEACPLPSLPVQYADFAIWQRRSMDEETSLRRLKYWKEQLSGMPEQLELPKDRPRTAQRTFAARMHRSALHGEEFAHLQRLARETNTTLYMVLLAAFATLLARYTGQDDVIVGSPIANRRDPQLERLIGFFINSLAMRVRMDRRMSFRQLLSTVRTVCLEAYEYQDLPFERIVEELLPHRSLNASPIFQVLFAFQNAPRSTLQLHRLAVEPFEAERRSVSTDIELHASEREQGLELQWAYSFELFDRWHIERMSRHYTSLLAAAVREPEAPLYRLNLLDAEESRLLLGNSPQTEDRFSGDIVCEAFEIQARLTPDNDAVIATEFSLTYKELNEAANRLAHHLIDLGAGPEILVGVCLERSVDLAVALLAILKSGGAYLPLPPEQPLLRLEQMAAAASPAIVISVAALAPRVPGGIRTLLLDKPATREALARSSAANPAQGERRSALHGGHAAYVIFTSGSTGKPKGVVVSHEALANKIAGHHRQIKVRPSTRYAVLSSLSFDPLLLETLCPLLAGAACVMVPDSIREDAEAFGDFVSKHRISVIDATPRLMEALLPEGRLPVRLQTLIIGGDVFPVALANSLLMHGAAEQILNLYGPTEVTVDATGYEIPKSGVSSCVPIGKPLMNYHTYVLDGFLELSPVGVTGEIYVGGAGLARGYLNQPELTAERFIADPFGPPGSRLYRTGDLARWNQEGMLEFLGRADQQIKLRGIRIEPEEIEAVMASHPEVSQAVVVLRGELPERQQLVGYLVPRAGSSPDSASVSRYVGERLPDYMVPPVLLVVNSLPLTPGGKLDWQALPLPPKSSVAPGVPRTAMQELLCNLFIELLGVDHVGIEDDFFALGGHSLLATRLVSRIRATLKISMTVRAFFEAPTVTALSLHLERQKKNYSPALPQVRPAHLPLSFAQERFWFINQLEGASPEYNVPEALCLCGELDVEAVVRAVNAIIKRHEILRTHFDDVDGKPIQVVQPALSFHLQTEDLSHLEEKAQREAIAAALRQEWEKPFDLATGPLFRMKLFKLVAQRHVLLRTFHHIVFDAWSQALFNGEFAILYNACRGSARQEKPEDVLKPLPIQYADFALWQRRQLDERTLSLQLEYWKRQLQGLPEQLDLPKDRPRPPKQTFTAGSRRFALSLDQTALLKLLGRENQATLFMTLLSTFAVLLSRYSGQSDVPIGSPMANRSDPDLQGLIGPFINSLVMRVQVKADESFRELLQAVRKIALNAYEHQDLPFERLVEVLAPQRSLNLTPFFQVMLAFHSVPATLQLDELEIEKIRNDEVRAHFDLEVHAEENEGRLEFFWVYNRDLFDPWRVEQMAWHFENLLATTASGTRVGQMEMLSAWEKRQVLEEWNATEQRYGVTACVHHLFEQQAERTPEAVAVECGGQELVYAELNRRANRWAQYLRKMGVHLDDVVGIAMERSLEMVVAILGTLKAGAAYLPLPPEYPAERLKIMVEDARPRALLVQSRFQKKFAGHLAPALCVDQEPEEIGRESSENTGIQNAPLNAAYLIYTSGSTGKPKGVVNTHDGLLNRLLWMQQTYQLGPDDVVLQKTPFGFDVSLWEFLWPLMVGAKLVMARPGGHQDPEYLLEMIERRGITTLHFVPSMLKAFLQAGGMEKCASLRRVICSGEALGPELARECLERIPAEMHNLYGPTEAAIDVTFWNCRGKTLEAGVAIGRPIANTRIYVLDDERQPLPPGIAGELFIAGCGLARGYLNQPELTAERFIPDPFSPTAGARMYRTGDLARWRPDGNLECLGRTDSQVKVRGCRIELGEIENSLREYEGVGEAVAAVYEDETGDKKIVAYVVRKPGSAALDSNQLLLHLKNRLPLYSVPDAILELDSLPLSANGKVDRKALPKPESAVRREAAFTPPQTTMEIAIASIWKEKLGLKEISIFDNFFDSGGHSLKAILVHTAVRKLTSRPLMLTDIFKYPTIASLAEHLTRDLEAQPAAREDGTDGFRQNQADREERLRKRLTARSGGVKEL